MKQIIFSASTEAFCQKGTIEQTVSKTYASKSLAANYSLQGALCDIIDNSIDSGIENNAHVNIHMSNEDNMFIIRDDAFGIQNPNFLNLGYSDKKDKGTVGRYGAGLKGAIARIAKDCVIDNEKNVEVVFLSAHNGKLLEQHVLFVKDEMIIQKPTFEKTNSTDHYTVITFSNCNFSQNELAVLNHLDKTYEETINRNIASIFVCSREISKSMSATFTGKDPHKTIRINDSFDVEVTYRMMRPEDEDRFDKKSHVRELEATGLRIYGKNSGRLLCQRTEYWQWFANRKAQQSICGLRVKIDIPETEEAFAAFGIESTKQGIRYQKYCDKKGFKELYNELHAIYLSAHEYNVKTNNFTNETESKISGYIVKTLSSMHRPIKVSGNTIELKEYKSKDDYIKLAVEYAKLEARCNALETTKKELIKELSNA